MINIDTIISYLTILYIIESVNKIRNRSFTSTCASYKCYLLTWSCIHSDIMKHHLVRIISKVYTIKGNITFKSSVFYWLAIHSWSFPCPHHSIFLSFCKLFICIILYIYKFNAAFVCFRLLII